ncbi:hypothetical protein CC86DRAFT_349540 [Ophiobolus disseminans]|uniref:Zn(2)-C6 fungal-type domain-containing protein n=1 Tax=Ophiobolus disseminans TaxID=1469910 RepID=A0A6A6ZZW8_9PLEO|nr:hypothetical protein CC86DRAFT_349540 [Ophiobolus disseminans]
MATHKRTRTGCWTCREAGYKCDEKKPHCARCIRLKITCKGYGVKLKWQDGNISTPVKRPRAKEKKSVHQVTSSSPVSIVSFASTPATFTSPSETTSSPESTRSLPLILFSPPQPSPNLSPTDRYLLHYWTTRLSTLISVTPRRHHSTPFQQHLTAMLHDSASLRSTILSMSANHLALSSHAPSLRIHAYRHQQDAIQQLQTLIQDPHHAATEPALATVLMMQVSARLFAADDDASAVNHLAGAQAMIARRGGVDESSSTRFLMSIFAYHDILSSVSRGAPPLAVHSTFSLEDEAEMRGIAAILQLVARISRLQHWIKARRGGSYDEPALTEEEDAEGRDIQDELLGMDTYLDGYGGANQDIAHTASAYRHAAHIYLHRTWLSIGAPHPISVAHVTSCLTHLSHVPIASPLTSSHTWPLFTAGCEAIDPQQRAFVKQRFADMYQCKQFPSLRRVMRDVQDVWGAKDEVERKKREGVGEGMARVDCIQVILRRGREVDLA